MTCVGAGTAVIRARIGRFYDQRTVTVTPCTKTRATFFAVDNAPAETTELGVDWTAASVKTVADKLLTPVIAGGLATVSAATIEFNADNYVAWSSGSDNGIPTVNKKEDVDGSAWNKCLVHWKDDNTTYGTTANTVDMTIATMKFTVTPKSGSVKFSSLSFICQYGRGYGVKAKIGSTALTGSGKFASKGAQTYSLNDTEISGATEVTLEFYIPAGTKTKGSVGLQDLTLSITK